MEEFPDGIDMIPLDVHVEGESSDSKVPLNLKPVPVAEFGDYVAKKHADSDKGFREQYVVS